MENKNQTPEDLESLFARRSQHWAVLQPSDSESDHEAVDMMNFLAGGVWDWNELDEVAGGFDQPRIPSSMEFEQAMLDILGHQAKEPDGIMRPVCSDFTLEAKLSYPEQYKLTNYRGNNWELRLYKGVILLCSENEEIEVGKCYGNHPDVVPLYKSNWLEQAGKLAEETSVKGSCIGYSNWVHSAAILAIMNDGIYEPVEGYDAYTYGCNLEVTGINYRNRKTGAEMCINKYPIIDALDTCVDKDDILILSTKEDSYDPSGFDQSAYAQPDSPYTEVFRRMTEIGRGLSNNDKEGLYNIVKCWYSQVPVATMKSNNTEVDYKEMSKVIDKVYLKENGFPCPFRVLPGEVGDIDFLTNYRLLPYTEPYSVGTTYHNQPSWYDPYEMLITKPKQLPSFPQETVSSLYNFCFKKLFHFSIFSSIYTESVLMGKVNGRSGQFYDITNKAGISWRLIKSNSLIYYVSYWVVGEPIKACGNWRCVEREQNIYQSPTFKASVKDIEFAKVMPLRIVSMVISVLPYTDDSNRAKVIKSLMKFAATLRGSSWQTSAYAGDMRYITLCALSGTGDVHGLIKKAIQKVPELRKLPFGSYYFLRMLMDFGESYDGTAISHSPLLKLPIRFCSIEKDWPQAMMWHMRTGEHATQCFIKLRDGILLEQNLRDKLLIVYQAQLEFLENLSSNEIDSDHFADLMDIMPREPYFNYILFIAFAWRAGDKLDAGKRQDPTPICFAKYLSDHHATDISTPHEISGATITYPRVADNFKKLYELTNAPSCMLHMLLRLAKTKNRLVNIFAIHPKDSKSKNREIPQMTGYMRAAQFVSESLITIYTDADEVDMMQDPEKYSKFVEASIDILGSGGLIRSEDKSFFCGYMHPEAMGMACLTVGQVVGSAAMTTAAALLRVDTERYSVLPDGCDPSIIEGIDTVEVNYSKNGKIKKTFAVKNYIHMMQGVRAVAAALVNTVFTHGYDLIMRDIWQGYGEISTFLMTTSDDSTRGISVTKSDYAVEIQNDYIHSLPRMVSHCMMMDSFDKEITSSRLSEFNNVAATPAGMMQQMFIHTHLTIQPLMGESIIDDIITVATAPKLSLTWGDSLDCIRSSHDGYLVLLQQKWLLTPEHMETLLNIGFLPNCDEALIHPQMLIHPNVCLKLIRLTERVNDVINGVLSIFDCLRIFSQSTERAKKPRYVNLQTNLLRVDNNIALINASRKSKGRSDMAAYRVRKHARRSIIRDKFFNFIAKPEPAASPDEDEAVRIILDRFYDIVITMTRPTRQDLMPCYQGSKTQLRKSYNVSGILALRQCNINIRFGLTDEEYKISQLDEESFKKWYGDHLRSKQYDGITFKSPGGRPLNRSYNEVLFQRPHAFSFFLKLPMSDELPSMLTLYNTPLPNFVACIYGGKSINYARSNNCKLSSGYSLIGNDIYIVYQLTKGRPVLLTKPHKEANIAYYKHGIHKILVSKADYSPIKDSDVLDARPAFSFITGNTTAVANYGNYLNTSSSEAVRRMRMLFTQCSSDMPRWINRFKPIYPHFPPDCQEITMKHLVNFQGITNSTRVKLIPGGKDYVTYDLNQWPVVEISNQELNYDDSDIVGED